MTYEEWEAEVHPRIKQVIALIVTEQRLQQAHRPSRARASRRRTP